MISDDVIIDLFERYADALEGIEAQTKRIADALELDDPAEKNIVKIARMLNAGKVVEL